METVAALTLAGAIATPGAGADRGACANSGMRTGSSAGLPDCRAYEQVSPVEKRGYDAISRISFLQYPVQASPSGDGVAYMGEGPFAGARGSGLPDARVSSRGQSGWSTVDQTPPSPDRTPAGGAFLGYDFAEDLGQSVVKVPMQRLASNMPAGTDALYNLFLRHPDGAYSLVNAAAPSSIPPSGCEICFQFQDLLAFAGASRDFTHVLFEANDSLEGTEAPAEVGNLYESSSGAVHLVGVLPDGVIAPQGAAPGAGGAFFNGLPYSAAGTNAWRNVNHAISEDGSKVVFQASADGGAPDPSQNGLTEVYDRIDGARTVEVSAPAPGAQPKNPAGAPAKFWAASTAGSRVLFTSAAELTTSSNTGAANNSQDLYRYDVASGQTRDLTVDANPSDAATGAGVQGVLGTSNDGSVVYFIATGELLEGQGVHGKPNLYVSREDPVTHATQLRFITTLAPREVTQEEEELEEEHHPGDSHDWIDVPAKLTSYVTPDGAHVAFMSTRSLTGYGNVDVGTGERDSEVYEYSAADGTLVCASCNGSGAPPHGSAFIGASLTQLASTPFHQPRVLSDDGRRLFFSSPDQLVGGAGAPHDKIYEYEKPGGGSCAATGGCVSLLSSGASTTNDLFLDASADGRDVFFATLSQLTGTDTDHLFDVYDARVDGGFADAVAPPVCSATCQVRAGETPAPALASGFNGVSGNLAPQPSKPTGGSAQAFAKALRACRKKPRKKRRICERLARRKYGHSSSRPRAASSPVVAHTKGRS